jgi:hypothetical protein
LTKALHKLQTPSKMIIALSAGCLIGRYARDYADQS